MSIKPITPKEAHRQFCGAQVPDFVIGSINKLLSQKMSERKLEINITRDEIIQEITKHPDFPKGTTRQDIFDNGWLNIEGVYKKAGWRVIYNNPACKNFNAYFTFSPKNYYQNL